MMRFPEELEPLLAVVAATLDDDGTLCWTNAGFRRLFHLASPTSTSASADRFFIQPSWPALRGMPAGAAGEVYRGLLTVGDFEGNNRSLRARVWREGAQLHLLAEVDIVDLELLNTTVMSLNSDYAATQFELAQATVHARQLNEELMQQKADLQATLDRLRRLEGLLPICMYCKRIRTDSNEWQQVEHYVSEHSQATFSHGLCPSCATDRMAQLTKPGPTIVK